MGGSRSPEQLIIRVSMRAFLRYFILIVTVSAVVEGCYYDKEETLYGASLNCATVSYTYSAEVGPIVAQYCATSGCHDANTHAGNVTLTNFAEASASLARINQRVVIDRTMPPSERLTSDQISTIRCWIANGAPQ